ncbi:MAG: hypothetical protein KC910_36045, partial [Candidatus Eremiobacteraeota bacterium]|nr:hypothetical protein [Candidatus Eremiobacteraeota bacterium]
KIVLGPSAGFEVTAPSGWVFDNESRRHTVIYPSNEPWPADKTPSISNAMYDKQGRGLIDVITKEVPLLGSPGPRAGEGRATRVRDFEGDTGRLHRVVYVETPETICRIELEAPDQASFAQAVPALEEVVRSLRFLGPDSGEYQAASAGQSILVYTSEIQDFLHYEAPQGWRPLPARPGLTVFQRASGSSYGIITVYDAKPGEGDPQADYEAAWNELARSAFDAGPAPIAESRPDRSGWQTRVGITTVHINGRPSTLVLAVLSGFGRRASILACSNENSLLSDVEQFVGRVEPWLSLASGFRWTFREQGVRQYLNGELVQLGDHDYATRGYTFRTDSYSFDGEIEISGRIVRLEERGTYTIRGNKLSLHGQGGTRRVVDSDGGTTNVPLPAWDRTYTFRMIDVPYAIHGPLLILEGVRENDIDGGYSNSFPNAFVYVHGYH